jgi:hypothetical protein
LNFSEAIEAAKNGQRIQRDGWNGKGMWLQLVKANEWSTSIGPAAALVPRAHRLPWIALKTADDGLVPWLASQMDILADDWNIVP